MLVGLKPLAQWATDNDRMTGMKYDQHRHTWGCEAPDAEEVDKHIPPTYWRCMNPSRNRRGWVSAQDRTVAIWRNGYLDVAHYQSASDFTCAATLIVCE